MGIILDGIQLLSVLAAIATLPSTAVADVDFVHVIKKWAELSYTIVN